MVFILTLFSVEFYYPVCTSEEIISSIFLHNEHFVYYLVVFLVARPCSVLCFGGLCMCMCFGSSCKYRNLLACYSSQLPSF